MILRFSIMITAVVLASTWTSSPMNKKKQVDKQFADNGGFLSISQRRAVCGSNCLYAFLKLHGYTADYDQVESAVGISVDGSSMLALRDGARSFGMKSEVVRCRLDDLKNSGLPAIAFGMFATINHPDLPASERLGHFVLVTDISADEVEFMDGTTCKVSSFPRDYFEEKKSTGVFLTCDNGPQIGWEFWLAFLSSLILLCFACSGTAKPRNKE